MAYRDLNSDLKFVKLLDPATITADANSASVDTREHDSAVLVAQVGESGDTLSGSVKLEVEVEESDDNSAWTDVADADLDAPVTGTNTGTIAVIDAAAEDDVVVPVGYRGSKRYVRVVFNLTGTHTNGTPVSAMAVLGHAHRSPTS